MLNGHAARPRGSSSRGLHGPPIQDILCVGEVLWDALPAGLFLGGAPFNVACHLRAAGVPATLVSRVGADALGEEVLRRAARYGVGVDLVQTDPALPTGFVRVTVDDSGNAEFEIVEPSAWDAIEPTDALLARAAAARAIVFGSLAQRNTVTRATIERLWDAKGLMVFDANLRPPYDDREIIRRSLQRADIVKLNDDELRRLATWFDLGPDMREATAALARAFACTIVCVTRGRDGAVLWHDGRWTEQPGFEVEVRDTVGAGDAFLAVLLAGLLAGTDDSTLLRHATLMGAWVVTQSGAVPPDQPAVIAERRSAERTAGAVAEPAPESASQAAPRPGSRGGQGSGGRAAAPRRKRPGR
ncbi:MAG TPA: carbohydrate kinase [Gemmatimonadaceae bacterium]|nr:carbohydrate kinase [Gemmatimonadaceae bacterium]